MAINEGFKTYVLGTKRELEAMAEDPKAARGLGTRAVFHYGFAAMGRAMVGGSLVGLMATDITFRLLGSAVHSGANAVKAYVYQEEVDHIYDPISQQPGVIGCAREVVQGVKGLVDLVRNSDNNLPDEE